MALRQIIVTDSGRRTTIDPDATVADDLKRLHAELRDRHASLADDAHSLAAYLTAPRPMDEPVHEAILHLIGRLHSLAMDLDNLEAVAGKAADNDLDYAASLRP